LLQLQKGILGYFAFLRFYGSRNVLRGQFLGKNHYILPKIPIFAHFGSRKVGKKQKIKKTFPTSCSKYPKVHFDQFLGQLKHFPQTYFIFRQKKNFSIFADSAKK
jgi:hypothetical protein